MYLHEPVAEEHLRPHGRICDPLGALLRKELALLAENGNQPIRLVGCERGRPHWPAGASFSRTSMEHLARNDFITLERQGTTSLGLGSRVEQMASQSRGRFSGCTCTPGLNERLARDVNDGTWG